MRWVFDSLFAEGGRSFDAEVPVRKAEVLARHAWTSRTGAVSSLDLFSDVERTVDAIGTTFGSANAAGYRRFAAYSEEIFRIVEGPFLTAERPSVTSLLAAPLTIGVGALRKMDGMRTMWRSLGDFFPDPRLRQLFGRYATYSGSSPFEAPATLNVIAHVERLGVWLVEGGMSRLIEAVLRLANDAGVAVRTSAEVSEIVVRSGRVTGVRLATGEELSADAVVWNGAVDALHAGLAGQGAKRATGEPGARSLSAATWVLSARTRGYPLAHHTVFFSNDYEREFEELGRRALPTDPTVYLCAPDRSDAGEPAGGEPHPHGERLFVLVNAPATGDGRAVTPEELSRCRASTWERLSRSGLELEATSELRSTTPREFEAMFPGTGGALYGAASHGMWAPFARAPARAKLPGLYFAGGTAHPGAGVPMATHSGRLCAAAVTRDLGSTRSSAPTAMPGGTSMR
jgi:1-hydroxycarotenoid 3,4-desaturase